MRGVKESNLTGLRKRISTLFLQYIKTPTFNPEAAHLLKVQIDLCQGEGGGFLCQIYSLERNDLLTTNFSMIIMVMQCFGFSAPINSAPILLSSTDSMCVACQVPQDPSSLRKNIYFCSSCNKYLASTEFYLSSNSRTPGKCRSCLKIDNDARIRQDYSHYRRMLKALRRSEESYNDNSQIAFLMQVGSQRALKCWIFIFDFYMLKR